MSFYTINSGNEPKQNKNDTSFFKVTSPLSQEEISSLKQQKAEYISQTTGREKELKSTMLSAKEKYDNEQKSDTRSFLERFLDVLGGNGEPVSKAQKEYNSAKRAYEEFNPDFDEKELDEGKSLKEKAKEKIGNAVEIAANGINAGVGTFNKNINATTNTVSDILNLQNTKVGKYIADSNKQADNYSNYQNENLAEKTYTIGDKKNISGEVVRNIVAALPDAAISILAAVCTGGTSVAAELGTKSTSLLSTLGNAFKNLAKNPMYYTSFIGEFGNDYESAKQDGATDEQATASSLIAATLNSIVEVGGGIEELPKALKNTHGAKDAILEWVKSSLDEGKEEIIQDTISQLTGAVMYDKDKAFYSTTDDNAIINPKRMIKEGAMGTAVGGTLGGGQVAFNSIVNAKTESQFKSIGEKVIRANGLDIDGIIEYSKHSINDDIRTLAQTSTEDNIKPQTAGKLYSYVCQDIGDAINEPKKFSIINSNFSQIINGTDSPAIRAIAISQYINKLTDSGMGESFATNAATSVANYQLNKVSNDVQQSTDKQTDSVFTEPSAQPPVVDKSKDYFAKQNGVQMKTPEQQKIYNVGKALGYNVVFGDSSKVLGQKVNGFKDGNGNIFIDYNSKTPMQTIFKHELTHFTESNPHYSELTEAFKNSSTFEKWVRNKVGDTKGSIASVRGKYQEMVINSHKAFEELSPSGAAKEMYADFVGDMLFKDNGSGINDILKNTDTKQHSKIVQFVLDYISYLKKKLSGNTQITLELSRLEDKFKQVLNKSVNEKTTAESDGVKFSIKEIISQSGKNYGIGVYLDSDLLTGLSETERKQMVKLKVIEELSGKHFIAYDNNNSPVDIMIADKKLGFKNSVGKYKSAIKELHTKNIFNNIKQEAVVLADELIKTAKYNHSDKSNYSHGQIDDYGKNQWEYWNVNIQEKNNTVWRATLNIANTNNGEKVLYDIDPIKKVEGAIKLAHISTDITVPQNDTSVKNSISINSENDTESLKNNAESKIGEKLDDENNSKVENPDFKFSISPITEQQELFDKYKNGNITEEDYRSSIDDLFKKTGDEYGTIKQGERVTGNEDFSNPVPQTLGNKKKIQRHSRTIIEGGELTEDMVNDNKDEILKGARSYTAISNEAALKYAEKAIESGNGQNIWDKSVNGGKVTKQSIAIGESLLKMYSNKGDTVNTMKTIAELCEMGTRAGQVTQAFSLLKRMSGVGQLYYVQKTVNSLNLDLQKKYGNKAPVVSVDEILASQLANSKSKEDFDTTYGNIMEDITSKVPATFLDKWNAWRYMSMLFNPSTHIRNIVGNSVFVPAIKVKNAIATGMEHIAVDEANRTKSIVVKGKYKDFGKSDFDNVSEVISGGGKLNPTTEVESNKQIFKTKWLESARKFNFDMLEKEDLIFLKKHYSEALGGFLQARGIDTKSVTNEQLEEARIYAIKEAQKATYRDASALANKLQSFSNHNPVANLLVEGVLPFKKTPINIVKRGVEYSPLGLIKTLSKGVYDLKTGRISTTEFIDGIAGGLTGTGIVAMGMALSSMGVITGGFSDSDDDKFKKLNGEQEYSVQIGDKSYTINWSAPVCIPLFMGVQSMERLSEDNNISTYSSIKSSILDGLEPIVNLSMLSGIQDLLSSVRYSSKEQIIKSIITNTVGSYFSQALPTISGKIANTIDSTRRSNYIDKSSSIPQWLQSAINTIESKTPVVSMLRNKYVDAWGQTKKTGSLATRAFQNFVSPGYLSDVEYDEIDKEVKRVYDSTADKGVIPDNAAKYISFKKTTKYLSKKEYENFATAKGQYASDYMNELINNESYKELTDSQKAEVMKDLYTISGAKAKSEISYSYDEINAMNDGTISKEKFDNYSDKVKKALVEEYFLDKYKKAIAYESKGGSLVDYYIKQEIKK